jgi:hypothetical protein
MSTLPRASAPPVDRQSEPVTPPKQPADMDRNAKDRDQPWKRMVGERMQAPSGGEAAKTEPFRITDPDNFYTQSL